MCKVDTKYFYRIERIESKRTDKVNSWHSRVRGKLCTIETMDWYSCAILNVYGVVWHDYGEDMPIRYRTSPVLKSKELDGVITIETENSVYTLRLENEV